MADSWLVSNAYNRWRLSCPSVTFCIFNLRLYEPRYQLYALSSEPLLLVLAGCCDRAVLGLWDLSMVVRIRRSENGIAPITLD